MSENPIVPNQNYLYFLQTGTPLETGTTTLEIKQEGPPPPRFGAKPCLLVTCEPHFALDNTSSNDGNLNNGQPTGYGLSFGSNSGEGIASKRTPGGNQYGLDFYTNFTRQLSIDNNGILNGGDVVHNGILTNGAIRMTTGLSIDEQGENAGVFAQEGGNCLQFGGVGSGEGIASQRQPSQLLTTTTQWGLDFYTASTPRLSIDNNGNVIVHGGDIQLNPSDCAEEFDTCEDHVEPGTVMVLNEKGILEPSQHPYDKKVAGVVSGAGSYKPGIVLGKQQCKGKRMPIALIGKVFCKVDASFSCIEVGDLLTTSTTPGHAMKAEDPLKAFGTVIGKALGTLKEGLGIIPVLVALQ